MSDPNNLKSIKMQGVRDETGELPFLSNHTQIASIFVGEEKQEWKIPVDLLCCHSTYFRSALKGEFTEGKAKTVDLPDEKPEAFGLVVEWLYTHGIGLSGRHLNDIKREEPSFKALLDSWILADYLGMRRLQNPVLKIMDERAVYHQKVPVNDVSKAYYVCAPDSRLGKWIIDILGWIIPQNDVIVGHCTTVRGLRLLRDVFVNMLGGMPKKRKFALDDSHIVPNLRRRLTSGGDNGEILRIKIRRSFA